MVEVGRVSEIWRYPVKSMAGERLEAAELGALGLHADRMWAVRDRAADVTTGAKRLPGLLSCTARFAAPPSPDAGPGRAAEVVVTLPDGTEVSSSDPAVHAVLSGYLDHDVELRPLPPLADKAAYRGKPMTLGDTRTLLGLDPDEPFPDMSMFPVRKLAEISRYATPPGSYADAYPVHLISAESLRTVGRAAPDSDFDVRRFRPTLVVETGSAADFPERDWCGGLLHAPHADLRPEIPTIRCVMPTHEQPELKRDREITRTIAATANRCLGVYGTVARPGRIAVGDRLDLERPRRSPLATAAGAAGTRVKKALMRAGTAALPKG
jgi:hypothetical protein